MEKDYKLLEAETLPLSQHDDASQRRSKRSNHAIAAVLLFLVATFWFTTVGPAFTIGHGGCRHKLTVEQRAARILKKHPLIGQ
jgi:membrane dipeptidase